MQFILQFLRRGRKSRRQRQLDAFVRAMRLEVDLLPETHPAYASQHQQTMRLDYDVTYLVNAIDGNSPVFVCDAAVKLAVTAFSLLRNFGGSLVDV